MNVAVIGRGPWGQNIVRTLREVAPGTDGLLIQSVGRDWREAFTEVPSPLWGAFIATPPTSHLEIATHFISKAVPVFVEKPLCLSVRETYAFVELAVRNPHVPLYVNHVHLFHPAYRLMKSRIDPSEIRSIKTEGISAGPMRDYTALWDYGPHDVAYALDLLDQGMPDSAFLNERISHAGRTNYRVTLGFAGAEATLRFGNYAATPQKTRTLTVETKHGTTWHYDDVAQRLTCDGALVEVPDKRRSLTAAVETFLTACNPRRERTFYPPVSLAVNVVRVLDWIERLDYAGEPT